MTQRLFLALWPPAVVIEELDAALDPREESLRWQPPDRWHITVAFLGDRKPEVEVTRLRGFPAPAVDSVRLLGAGTFGPVLWVGVESSPRLPELADAMQRWFAVEERRFRPHLTVARGRPAEARETSHRLRDFRSSSWRPEELTLVRSTLGQQPSYEVIGRCPLHPA